MWFFLKKSGVVESRSALDWENHEVHEWMKHILALVLNLERCRIVPWLPSALDGLPTLTSIVVYFSTNRIGSPELCAVLRTHRLNLFAYPDSLIHFDRSASLSTRSVASLLSWGLSVAFIGSLSSLRVSARYALNTWRVMQGLGRRLRRHSHCNPSRADQNRT